MDAAGRAALIGARQHGIVARRELRAEGMTDKEVAGLVGRGLLVRLARGVYRWQGAPPTWRQQAMAAVKSAGGHAALSHQSAAVLHGLAGFRPGRVHVTVSTESKRVAGRWTAHRARLGPSERTVVDGIPVVTVPVALVQVAATLSPSALEDAFDDALCRGLVTLERAVDACRRGRPGSAALRGVAQLWRPGERPATVAEARLVRRLLARGLPRPAAARGP